jgi:hypothetical protein
LRLPSDLGAESLGALNAEDAETVPAYPGVQGDTKAAQRLPAQRFSTLPSLRIAVMSAGAPGEVRVIPLEDAAAPPPGAAVAILVPATAADGDEVAKLFGSLL